MIRSTPQSDSLDRCFRTWWLGRPRRDDRSSRRAASRGVCACQAQGECLPEPVVKILRCDKRTFPGIALAVTIYFWAAVAPAADLANTGTDHSSAGVPWLLGDWDGARTRLKAAGVDFQLGYVGEIAGKCSRRPPAPGRLCGSMGCRCDPGPWSAGPSHRWQRPGYLHRS
jgi:hypothetical protein